MERNIISIGEKICGSERLSILQLVVSEYYYCSLPSSSSSSPSYVYSVSVYVFTNSYNNKDLLARNSRCSLSGRKIMTMMMMIILNESSNEKLNKGNCNLGFVDTQLSLGPLAGERGEIKTV